MGVLSKGARGRLDPSWPTDMAPFGVFRGAQATTPACVGPGIRCSSGHATKSRDHGQRSHGGLTNRRNHGTGVPTCSSRWLLAFVLASCSNILNKNYRGFLRVIIARFFVSTRRLEDGTVFD